MKRAAIYVRISDDREGAGLGVARQEADCRKLAEGLGWTVVEVYVDNDTSAYSGRGRKAYSQLLDDVRSGQRDAILAWHNDRLHRHPRELEDFITLLEQHDIRVQTVRAGAVDLATPAGRMIARQLGAVARYESEHKGDRSRAKHRELAASGAIVGGNRPYGYRRIYDRPEKPHRIIRDEVIPEEAAIIRECATRVLAGEALSSVCRDLNARGIRTVNDKEWASASLARMLASARIAGLREHRPRGRQDTKRINLGEITAVGQWEAIILPAESARLRSLLSDPERSNTRKTGRTSYLLTGILFCPKCGTGLVGRKQGSRNAPVYYCHKAPGRPGCARTCVSAGSCDATVAEMVASVLSGTDRHARLEPAHNEQELLDEIQVAQTLLADLATDVGEGHMTRLEFQAARKPLQARVDAAKKALAGVDSSRALSGVPTELKALREWLLNPTVAVSRRQAVVKVALVRIDVMPPTRVGKVFDPTRLKPTWRY